MSTKRALFSKRFFFANLVLVGVLIGFSVSVLVFSCSTGVRPGDSALAQETDEELSVDISGLEGSFRNVAQAVLPSVVKVTVEQVRTQEAPEGQDLPWFDFFFGQPDDDEESPEFRTQGLGSGVIVRKDGDTYYVLTNEHVISEADSIEVELDNGETFSTTVVGTDTRKDLALLSFETNSSVPKVARLGDSDELHVGDWVLAVGSPFGFQSTVTAGIVSAVGRRGGPQGNISDFIQTDAAINQGNSGGALVNLEGEVVGINTWITSRTGGSVGLGFSIPINNVKSTIDDFISEGEAVYGWLGVSIQSPPQPVAEQLGVSDESGALVYHVFQGSPADKAGLQPGDFVTSINGTDVEDHNELILRVGELPVGEDATFSLIRQGSTLEVTATIERRQEESEIAESSNQLWPGASVYPLTEEIRGQIEGDVQEGLVVTSVEQRTPAADAGLQPGDVIQSMAGEQMNSVAEFYRVLNSDRDEFEIEFVREGQSQTLTLQR
jgi:Do/DeqQ family serine protease